MSLSKFDKGKDGLSLCIILTWYCYNSSCLSYITTWLLASYPKT